MFKYGVLVSLEKDYAAFLYKNHIKILVLYGTYIHKTII